MEKLFFIALIFIAGIILNYITRDYWRKRH